MHMKKGDTHSDKILGQTESNLRQTCKPQLLMMSSYAGGSHCTLADPIALALGVYSVE